jgi:hypothetical protein
MQSVIETAFPSPDAVAIVVIGDAAELREQLGGYGPITHMPLTRPDFGEGRAAG